MRKADLEGLESFVGLVNEWQMSGVDRPYGRAVLRADGINCNDSASQHRCQRSGGQQSGATHGMSPGTDSSGRLAITVAHFGKNFYPKTTLSRWRGPKTPWER
jgi:hypothetical protein